MVFHSQGLTCRGMRGTSFEESLEGPRQSILSMSLHTGICILIMDACIIVRTYINNLATWKVWIPREHAIFATTDMSHEDNVVK